MVRAPKLFLKASPVEGATTAVGVSCVCGTPSRVGSRPCLTGRLGSQVVTLVSSPVIRQRTPVCSQVCPVGGIKKAGIRVTGTTIAVMASWHVVLSGRSRVTPSGACGRSTSLLGV